MRVSSLARSVGALICLASPILANGVRILRPAGTANFPDIQSAVNQAVDGEVILVGGGTYAGFQVSGKSLSILSNPSSYVTVTSPIEISAIAAGKQVNLSGFDVESTTAGPALVVSQCAGDVRVQYCILRSPASGGCWWTSYPSCDNQGSAEPGAKVAGSARVAFFNCNFYGGNGSDCSNYLEIAPNAGDGLRSESSGVALYDCQLTGGNGGPGDWCSGDGGAGCYATNGFLFASSCTFKGGDGPWAYAHWSNGIGGAGLNVSGGQAYVAACGTTGGMSACYNFPCWAPNVIGSPVVLPVNPRRIFPGGAGGSGVPASVQFTGQPGDRFFLASGARPDFRYVSTELGMRLLAKGFFLPDFAPVTIPASGSVVVSVPMPITLAGQVGTVHHLQAWVLTATNDVRWSNPLQYLAIDPAAGPDCNGNGVDDFLDVIQGTGPDLNENLIPDTCPGG